MQDRLGYAGQARLEAILVLNKARTSPNDAFSCRSCVAVFEMTLPHLINIVYLKNPSTLNKHSVGSAYSRWHRELYIHIDLILKRRNRALHTI